MTLYIPRKLIPCRWALREPGRRDTLLFVTLTKPERLNLLNQYRILEKVDRENAPQYQRLQEILTNGYSREYGELYEGIDDEIPLADCEEVCAVVTMYHLLHHSYENSRDKSGLTPADVEFSGFDGNAEADHLAYARFLKERDQWEEHVGAGTDELNSHCSRLPMYRAMLIRWKDSEDPYDLSREDILRILDL